MELILNRLESSYLLSGSTGFVGRHILNELVQSGLAVKTIGRDQSCDYVTDFAVDFSIPIEKFKCVIHSAGKAHIAPKTPQQAEEFFRINVNGTKQLIGSLERSELPESFILISTVAVYGKTEGHLIPESTSLMARDPYGLSKIIAEEEVQNWCDKNGVQCTILRLPLVAGQNPPGNLNALIKSIRSGLYFDIGGGRAKKSMVLASDVARIIPRAAQVGGIFNLTDGCHPSFRELSVHIADQLGKGKPWNAPESVAWIIAKAGDVLGSASPLNSRVLRKILSELTFDDSKARAELGWNPRPVIKEVFIKS